MQKKGYFLTKSDHLRIINITYLLSDYSLMGNTAKTEVKNTIPQTPEQIKQAKEAADRAKIKNAPANKVAENIKKTETPENKNGIKDKDQAPTKVETKSTTPVKIETKSTTPVKVETKSTTPVKVETTKPQEVRKETDLVSDRLPDLNNDVMKVILAQYKVLGRKPSDGYRPGEAVGFDKLSVKQLYDLPVTTKANIAYLSSMITYESK
jgi:hypothetical protein